MPKRIAGRRSGGRVSKPQKWTRLIDPPNPYDTLKKWERFLAALRGLPKDGALVRQSVRQAERTVAAKKRGAAAPNPRCP
jgi:hypothetical protein